MIESANIDGRNMAALLSNITSGINVFEAVFESLESKYSPFVDADFREIFYREVSK